MRIYVHFNLVFTIMGSQKGPISFEVSKLCHDIASDNAGDIIRGEGAIIGSVLRSIILYAYDKADAKKHKYKCWILKPDVLPELEIPYTVKGYCDITALCFFPCATSYSIVLYNTHSGSFKSLPMKTNEDMKIEFDYRMSKIENILTGISAVPDAIRTTTNQKYVMHSYAHNPNGISRGRRLVNISDDGILTFSDPVIATTNIIVFLFKTISKRKCKFMDKKTGSWKVLLDKWRLKHKVGSEQGTIFASVSDFIGAWTCTTGESDSIERASNGVIDPDAKFINFFAAYTCPCVCKSKPSHYCCRVGSRFDIVSAWQ